MESWILRVSYKVNVKPFGLHLLCKRPEVFMIPWTFQKSNSFLKCASSYTTSYTTNWIVNFFKIIWGFTHGDTSLAKPHSSCQSDRQVCWTQEGTLTQVKALTRLAVSMDVKICLSWLYFLKVSHWAKRSIHGYHRVLSTCWMNVVSLLLFRQAKHFKEFLVTKRLNNWIGLN